MTLRRSFESQFRALLIGVILCASASACSANGINRTPSPDSPTATVVQPADGTSAAASTPIPAPVSNTPTRTPPRPTDTAAPPSPTPEFARHFVDNEDCAAISQEPLAVTTVSIVANGRSAEVQVEVALTGQQKQQGLMCRETLDDGTGMLFPYDSPSSGGYWMYNTYMPLEILYIAPDGAVVSVSSMAPCPRQEAESKSRWQSRCAAESSGYRPAGPYIAALELPEGWLESKGFDIADAVGVTVHWNQ